MDILGDMLTSMRVESALFAHLSFRAPWGVAFTTGDQARLVVLARGGSWVLADCFSEPVWVEAGDCLIIKGDAVFTMVSEVGVELVPCATIFSKISGVMHEYGGHGAVTELVSGRFYFDAAAAEPLLSLLPNISLVRRADVRGPLMRTTLELVGLETELDGLGAGIVVKHLINALFVQALRAWCEAEGGRTPGWLAGLRDARISRALKALHADIAFSWTISGLARHAGMSRSSFAATFKVVLGETPVEYLTRWRIHRAKVLLKQGTAISDVARCVGYETDAALNHAFNRIEGVGPGAWRRATTDEAKKRAAAMTQSGRG